MRFEVGVGAMRLVLAATASSSAQPGSSPATSTPAPPRERAWTYEVALGPAMTFVQTDPGSPDDAYRCIGLRLGVGRWLVPEAVLSLRIAWTMMLFEPSYGHSFSPSPAEFSSVAGPNLARWITDRLWIAGTLGASFRHLREYTDDGPRARNAVGFAYGGNAGFVVYADGADAVSVSIDATRAVDGNATTTYSLLVGYQRL